MVTRVCFLIAILTGASFAQNGYHFNYAPTGLSGPMVVTVQSPPSATKNIQMDFVNICVPTAVRVTIERDGTTATATAGTAVKDNTAATPVAATAQVYSASNSTGGTVATLDLLAGCYTIDLKRHMLYGNKGAARQNITIRTGSVTGNGVIEPYWNEAIF